MSSRRHQLPGLLSGVLAAGDGLAKVSSALLHLAAGTLRHAQLNAMKAHEWRAFYTDDAHVLSGFMPWEQELYGGAAKPGDRILIVGCGSGRDMLPFLDRGHQVVGIDPSAEPVARLRKTLEARGQSADIIQGFVEDVALPGQFDLIIFSWICYSYILQSSRRVAILRQVAAHLAPAGRIVLTYIELDGPREARAIRLTQWVARLTGSDWTPEPHDVMTSQRDNAGERVLHLEHWFTPQEIEAEAREAGLRIVSHKGPVGVPTLVLGL